MITKITIVSLYAILQPARAMSRAGERAVFAPSHLRSRFWQRVGSSGEALESFLDRAATRFGISAHLVSRSYGI